MDELLLFLLKHNAHVNQMRFTTSEIGGHLGMSQQNVSRRLQILEKQGCIERKGCNIGITKKGIEEARSLHAALENALGAKLEICGTIIDGLGEGKFYLSQEGYRAQIKEKLGFDPYPGTLNVKLDIWESRKRQRLLALEPVLIKGFEKDGRRFGDLFAYKSMVGDIECAVVVPLRTHHGADILEIASPVRLREQLSKKAGDNIRILIGQVR
jgi:riboflavin kinase